MERQESESLVVPPKPGNRRQRDSVKGRGDQEAEPDKGKMNETQRSENVTTKLRKVAELAGKYCVLTSVSHVIDLEWMKEAYRRTRKSGAVGVDGRTSTEYAANLEENLSALLRKLCSGTYQPPPVRKDG
jgi:retron-type reverse transcriptase